MPLKRCSRCRVWREHGAFHRNRAQRDGRHNTCKTCCRERYRQNREAVMRRSKAHYHANKDRHWETKLMRNYGITAGEYEEFLESQGGVCAICGKPCRTRKRLAVDHDHDSGLVRGLLCNDCNRGLGLLGDSVNQIRRALQYLEGSLESI